MKRISIVLIAVLFTMIFTGCSSKSQDQYQQAMIDGESKVIEEEYDKAIDYFELALDIKEDDAEAKNLIKQLNLLVASLKPSGLEGDEAYFYQIEKLEQVCSIDTEKDIVKKKANKCKQAVLANIDNCIADIEKDIDCAKYQSCQKELEGMIVECKEYSCLKTQLDRCNKLLDICVANNLDHHSSQQIGKQQTQVSSSSTTNVNSQAAVQTNHNRYCKYGTHYVSSASYNAYTGRCYSCDKICASQQSCTNTGSTNNNNYCNNNTSSTGTHHSTNTGSHHSGGHH